MDGFLFICHIMQLLGHTHELEFLSSASNNALKKNRIQKKLCSTYGLA